MKEEHMDNKNLDVGLVGLGVMGRNFALNLADNGYSVCVYNRTEEKTRKFISGEGGQAHIVPVFSLSEMVSRLAAPRTVLIFVSAGDPVDQVIDELRKVLTGNDLIVDCGNSHFKDTDRRIASLSPQGLLFLGMGVSGGESGARHGPSLMPGGAAEGYDRIRKLLAAAAAKANGKPCVGYLGPASAGHYVKMVHNGIEYGIMELIAETYDLFTRGLGLEPHRMVGIYESYNAGRLNSYLMEITAKVIDRNDSITGNPLLSVILDKARQKGTGKWTSMDALALQTPVPTIDSAVAQRNMSDEKSNRQIASRILTGPSNVFQNHDITLIQDVESALLAAAVITYAQGMRLLYQASKEYGYRLDLSTVAKIWRSGCIIRAALLEDIREAFSTQPDLDHLLLDPVMGRLVNTEQDGLRSVLHYSIDLGIPMPGFMSALAYFDAFRSDRLPANLIMAQRDFFGAHRYERIDEKGTFHTDWES